MALGDSIEVTYMIGNGKTESETVKVETVGGTVHLEASGPSGVDGGSIIPTGLLYVTAYTRKWTKVTRLVVSTQAFVAAVERKRGR